jgi:protein involved in polysaccharide export with SLBB domain
MNVRRTIRLTLASALCCVCIASYSQTATPPTAPAATTVSSVAAAPIDTTSLSAAQIDDLLQQHPELIVDLKSLVADLLQQSGTPVQADSITDEQLYRLIATSANTRAGITTWLQARGYVSASDLHRADADDRERDTTTHSAPGDPTIDPLRKQSTLADLDVDPVTPLSMTDSKLSSASQPLKPRKNPSTRDAKTDTADKHDSPELIHRAAPYNLLSLRDLYTQLPPDNTQLRRFGSDVFLTRDDSPNASHDTLDVPVGPDYILGSGDNLVINLWGGVSQTFSRTVDREGKIVLPEAGTLVVSGLSLGQAQTLIGIALQKQYRNAQIAITLGKLRTIRVYVVGDVQRPGAYDLNALSMPLNALYAAGGPTSVGSLRIVKHYRGEQLLGEVDLYDFLLRGHNVNSERLASGDTLLIPAAGPQVAVSGAVKRPAIYELKGEESLAILLDDAGGVAVAASLDHITIDRIQPSHQRETITLPSPVTSASLAAFLVHDGDRVHLGSILPYSERVVYVEGHVARPGKVPYRDGLQLSDVLRSYSDLLPEPAATGDIIRLVPPDLHAETSQFNVADVLIGNVQLTLQPFDTIRINGRYEVDPPQVTVRGEVLRPGIYPLSRGMTAAQLVRMAGGFKRDALLESADLSSYIIQDNSKVISRRSAIPIGEAMQSTAADTALKPGDILTIHQISGWNDIGSSVVIEGEVTYPGSYGLQEGERLSSVLRRAGGLRGTAYANGAVLVRTQVKELEEKSREELIREIETTSASARLAPNLSGQDEATLLQAATQQQNEVLEKLRSQPSSGRLVIHISSDIDSWANTDADIELRSGDILSIPKRPGFVLVSGQVYNPSAITYVPNQTAGWYLKHAGGSNDVANNKEIFVVHANGSVVGRRSGGAFSGSVLSTKLEPGDVIVVPQKIIGGSLAWRNLLTVAQITSSIAITAALAGLF